MMNDHDPTLQALTERIRAARADGQPLEVRGGGTKAFLGGVPRGEVLDVRALSGISAYEPTELVVTVRAGTLLAELEAALAERGQALPFEPPRFGGGAGPNNGANNSISDGISDSTSRSAGGGTVGGMVAAGLAGPARAAVGSVRDYVLGATMLDGRGQLLSFGGQVMKNVAGYDVSRLLAGSMGVLGVICEVSLKVLPRPVATATLRFDIDEAGAIQRLNAWGGQPLPLNASAWQDGVLHLRLAGAAAAVDAATRRLGGQALGDDEATALWDSLRDQRSAYFAEAQRAVDAGGTLWRLSVPQVAPPLALPGPTLLEWGGAQRWCHGDLPAERVRAAAAAAGGHATALRTGDAALRAAGVFAPLDAPLARIHRELKRTFDPAGILNPGRLYPDV
jgi:glycolate oxidase FAD binding subunit